jgi:hypothetical protein
MPSTTQQPWSRPLLQFDFSPKAPRVRPLLDLTPAWLKSALEAARRWFEHAL